MNFGDQIIPLEQGDSLYFDGKTRHYLVNPYEAPAQVLCVFYAREFNGD